MKKILKKMIYILFGREMNQLRSEVNRLAANLNEISKNLDFQYRDLIYLQEFGKGIKHNSTIILRSDYPIAYESLDHINPFGTIQDNTRNFSFYLKCKQLFGDKLSFLDLGCSGGGLVFEFALHGYLAIGLEGSDLSKKMGRANWRTIPNNLFTCDITKSFELIETNANKIQKFKVISCWEVLEHIAEKDIDNLMKNIKRHLDFDGIFVGSISKMAEDPLHVTIKTNEWWKEKFRENGFHMEIGYNGKFEFYEFCRGIGGGMFDSHNYLENPEKGFHFVANLK